MFAVSGTVVGIVIRYGLDDPRFELACGLDFPQPSSLAADLYHSPVNYISSNKQRKRIPAAVQTGSRTISQRKALQLQ